MIAASALRSSTPAPTGVCRCVAHSAVHCSACLACFDFQNRTHLDTSRLASMCLRSIAGWPIGQVSVLVRYSRGADFSGRCIYGVNRLYINLGAHLRYPYLLRTHLARAVSARHSWRRPVYTLTLADAYQLTLFIFLHEWYHLLVKRARRNTRQKEGMCDRFAAREIVDRYAGTVADSNGLPIPRAAWDFQDLNGFVAAARGPRRPRTTIRTAGGPTQQLFLFEP